MENWPKTDTTKKGNTPSPKPHTTQVDDNIDRATKADTQT
jgi:hypothetical protein